MAKGKLSAEALEFFRQAGRRSAKARLKKLTPEQRSDVARKAAAARWKDHKPVKTKAAKKKVS